MCFSKLHNYNISACSKKLFPKGLLHALITMKTVYRILVSVGLSLNLYHYYVFDG